MKNLGFLYESGLVDYLIEKYSESTIILFGSYSYGEDNSSSDIDFAVIGAKEKNVQLEKYEEILERKILLQFYKNLKEINKNLKENILNGIIIKGGVEL